MTVRKITKTTLSIIIMLGIIIVGCFFIRKYLTYMLLEPVLMKFSVYKDFEFIPLTIINISIVLIFASGLLDTIMHQSTGLGVLRAIQVPLVTFMPLMIIVYLKITDTFFLLILFLINIISVYWSFKIISNNIFSNKTGIVFFSFRMNSILQKENVDKIDRLVLKYFSLLLSIWFFILVVYSTGYSLKYKSSFFSPLVRNNVDEFMDVRSGKNIEQNPLENLEIKIDNDESLITSETSVIDILNGHITASSELKNHYAIKAFDKNIKTNWQESAVKEGNGEFLEIQFKEETEINGMILYLGSWKSEELYYKNNRPSAIILSLDNYEYELEFSDLMRAHVLLFSKSVSVNNIRLTIKQVYYGSVYQDTVISEVELY